MMGSVVVYQDSPRDEAGTEPPHKEQPMFAGSGEAGRHRPHVVIAHSDTAYVLGVARAFRRHGWDVALAAVGQEARRLAVQLSARLVVLETSLPDETGWLTCAKLTVGDDAPSVVLVADEDDG